jgi:hypothetical protein
MDGVSTPAQLADQGDDFGVEFSVRLTTFHLLARDQSLALPGSLELGNDPRPIKFAHGAEYLPDQLRCGRVVEERVRAIGGDQLDAQGLQLREADLLDHYVAPVIWVTDAIPFVSYLTRGQ